MALETRVAYGVWGEAGRTNVEPAGDLPVGEAVERLYEMTGLLGAAPIDGEQVPVREERFTGPLVPVA